MFLKIDPEHTHSLAFRLTVTYAAVASLFSVIAFGVFYYKLTGVTMDAFDEELFEEVRELTDLFVEHGVEGVKLEIAEENQSEDNNQLFFRLYDGRGRIITSTDMSGWPAAPLVLGATESSHIKIVQLPGRAFKDRIITTKIAPDLILQHGRTIKMAQEYLGIFRQLFMVVLLISVLMAGIVGGLMARKALKGVNQVTETALLVARGHYRERVRIDNQYEEINRLANAFNIMVERVQDLVERMRDVIGNIAHELRNPLARIRGIAEMSLISKSAVMTPAEAAQSAIEECDTLIEMVNTMLDLTEIEAGVDTLEIEPIELKRLLEDACELFRPLALAQGVKIKLHMEETIIFHSDASRLQRLVYNLLDNAIKYTPSHGRICLRALKRDGQVVIEVEDTGQGIEQEDLPHIFDRFYRADHSRATPGSGLGLSLVKAIATALGGTIRVSSQPHKGSRFSINLPQLQAGAMQSSA